MSKCKTEGLFYLKKMQNFFVVATKLIETGELMEMYQEGMEFIESLKAFLACSTQIQRFEECHKNRAMCMSFQQLQTLPYSTNVPFCLQKNQSM